MKISLARKSVLVGSSVRVWRTFTRVLSSSSSSSSGSSSSSSSESGSLGTLVYRSGLESSSVIAKRCLSTTATGTQESQQESFHKRVLPDNLVSLSSPQGRRMFQEALLSGEMESYFPLSEQFVTQSEPSFCALSSLAMVLNALNHDPGRVWRSPWRWVSEEMLQCETQEICGHSLSRVRKEGTHIYMWCVCVCVPLFLYQNLHTHPSPLTSSPTAGMNFSQFESLAACHGVKMKTYRVADPRFKPASLFSSTASASANSGISGGDSHHDQHCGLHSLDECQHKNEAAHALLHAHHHHHSETESQVVDLLDSVALNHFRTSVQDSCRSISAQKGFLIANFSRQVLKQTGDGHFSPIAGYHKSSDSVLVMDTARFKYPPFWVQLPLLWEAMGASDPLTGEARGYFVVEKGGAAAAAIS